jgi:hypothetical protein
MGGRAGGSCGRDTAWAGASLERLQYPDELGCRGALLVALRAAPGLEVGHLLGAVLGHAQRPHAAAHRRLSCGRQAAQERMKGSSYPKSGTVLASYRAILPINLCLERLILHFPQ